MDPKSFELTDLFQANNEHILPTFSYNVNSSLNKMTMEVKIVELIILITGFVVNITVLLAIIIRNSMHTTTGCYLFNLVVCNFIGLLDILGNVVHRWFYLSFEPDVEYINRVTLVVYICTITLFSMDRYITFCCNESSWRITLTEISTAIKGIVIIWCFASIFTAMEFNLYNKFPRQTVINLYTFTTAMFLITATVSIVILIVMIAIQMIENKVYSEEIWSVKPSDSIQLLVGITVVFYLTFVPDRVITILYYHLSYCCPTIALCVLYYIAKISTVLQPIIWITTSKLLRKCTLAIIVGRWKAS